MASRAEAGKSERTLGLRFSDPTSGLAQRYSLKGKIGILFDMHDFHGWGTGALWEDGKFAMKHFRDIGRLAVVGEKRWQKGMAAFCRPFTKAKVRYFDHNYEDEADAWLQE